MKNIQKKINKLVLAFKMKGKIIKIDQKQLYSHKYEKVFTVYNFSETTKDEMKLKFDLRELKKEEKETKDKKIRKELEEKIKKITKKLSEIKVPSIEFSKKINLLLYMVERYKELV